MDFRPCEETTSSPQDIIEMAAATGSRSISGSSIIGSGALNRSPSAAKSYSDMAEQLTMSLCNGHEENDETPKVINWWGGYQTQPQHGIINKGQDVTRKLI